MKLFRGTLSLAGAYTMAALLSLEPASAQTKAVAASDAADEGLGEIVVTAQKRIESLQNVPISATVLNAEELTKRGVNQLADLTAVVPNLYIINNTGAGIPVFTLRGIGAATNDKNSNSTVAVYLDEFVLDTNTTKSGQMFDLERVEALRGPQGTLYGKNSTGGAINFITRRPDGSTSANGTFTVGRFGEYDIDVGAQTGLSDKLSIRVAGNRNYSDGPGFNVTTNKHVDGMDDWGGRVGLRYKDDDWDVFLKAYIDELNSAIQNQVIFGVNFDGSPRPDNSNPITGFIPPSNRDVFASGYNEIHIRNRGAGLNADYDIGSVTLTSISGYVHSKSRVAEDVDGSPFTLANLPHFDIESDQVSQELRLTSGTDSNFSWLAGINFFHRSLHNYDNYDLSAAGVPLIIHDFHEKDTSFAGYFDGTLKLGGGFSVVAGARLTYDKKKMHIQSGSFSLIGGAFDVRDSASWTEPTYRLILNYQMNPDVLYYASYSHGYRSGSYGSGLVTTTDQFRPVDPEFVDNYEGGIKATLFDRHLRFALSFYYMQFKDMQVNIARPGGICCSVVNAGKARVYGTELEGTAVLADNLNLQFEGSYSNGRFQEFLNGALDYSGETLGYLPKYRIKLSPEYEIPVGGGNIFIAPEIAFTGKTRPSVTPDPFFRDIQKAYTVVNGQLGYRADAGLSVFAWIKNATNKRYIVSFTDVKAFGIASEGLSVRRTFGITASARY